MKTAAEIANHPKARLHQQLVAILRTSGSVEGAEQKWILFQLNTRFWKRIVKYGLAHCERQLELNKIAFPDSNVAEVDAALRAGNNLNRLYELACGRASVAKDSAGHYKRGSTGLKIIRHATAILRPERQRTMREQAALRYRGSAASRW